MINTYERVSVTVSSRQSISGWGSGTGGQGVRVSDIKRLKINPKIKTVKNFRKILTYCFPQLADVVACLAESVDTGVRVGGGGVRGDRGVGGVGAGGGSADQGEDTADSKGGRAGSRGRSAQTVALRGRVAGAIEVVGAGAHIVGELDNVEN